MTGDDNAPAAQSWADSAAAYIAFQDAGDRSRTMLLDPVMLRLCGDVRGKRVLDLGCGEGRFSRMLGEQGATTVAIDLTPMMVTTARTRDTHGGAYLRTTAERLPLADATFDLVVNYITLVDIPDFRAAIAESARVLRPGGEFLIANVSFLSASPVEDPWERDASGNKRYRRIDNYMDEQEQVFAWAGMRIVNWHRPLESYMKAYLGAGLILRDFLQPRLDDDSLRDDPWWWDTFRIPNFNVMRWQKP